MADCFSPYMRNCTKIAKSSTSVPSDPINHGKFFMKYTLSTECNRIPAPYVKFPTTDRMKNNSERP